MKVVLMEPLGILDEQLQELSSFLKKEGNDFVAYATKEENTEKLIHRVQDADIIILANQPLPKSVLQACPHLKMVAVAFTGVDHVDVAYCKEQGICVCNAAGYSTNAVAELAFGLMIDVYRYILPCDKQLRNSGTKGSMIGFELCGKKLGIIGTGAIGMKVAQIGKAFGCELLGYSRTKKAEGEELGIQYLPLEQLLKQSDIVSLHMPMNPSTKGMINKEKIALMKPSAILINTARGGVIDNEALAQALKEGKIAGAGIDVFEMEPPIPKDYPLIDAPNTILTPHIAFATKESLYKRAVIVFENVRMYFNGTPRNLV